MPGQPVGTAFALLDLDTTPMERGLTRVNEQLTSGTMKVEDAYKSLGIKSNAVYDAMRQNATAAVEFIQNKTLSSTEEIARAQKAAADKIAQINEEQRGAQTSVIDTVKAHWVETAAAAVAAWMAINQAVAWMEGGAKAQQVASSFKIMSDEAGASADSLLASMQKATQGTIADTDLMQKATKLMLAGYDPGQIERFSAVAITASQYMGVNVSESFDRIADSLASRMPRAMIQSGAVTKEQMLVVQEAIKAGADSTSLMDLAIANLTVKMLQLQGTQDQATLSLQRFHAEVTEMGELFGSALIRGLQMSYGGLLLVASGAGQAEVGIYRLLQGVRELAAWSADKLGFTDRAASLRTLAGKAGSQADTLDAISKELAQKALANMTGAPEASSTASKAQIDSAKAGVDAQMKKMQAIIDTSTAQKKANSESEQATKRILEETRKATVDAENLDQNAYALELARIESKAEKYRQLGVDRVNIENYVAAETALVNAKIGKDAEKGLIASWVKSADEEIANSERAQRYENDRLAELVKGTEKAQDLLIAGWVSVADAQINEDEKAARYEVQRYEDMYRLKGRTLSGTLENLEAEKDGIQSAMDAGVLSRSQAAELIRGIEDRKTIAILSNYERELAEDKNVATLKLANAQGYFERMKIALGISFQDWRTADQKILDLTSEMAKNLNSTVSDIFFDAMTGQLKSFGDYWKAFWSSTARTMSDELAKGLTSALLGSANSGSTGGFGGGLLGLIGGLFGGTASYGAPSAGASLFESMPIMESFDAGGTVPGPIGTPIPIIAHAGEKVLTPAQQRAGSGPLVVQNITINAGVPEAVRREIYAARPMLRADAVEAIVQASNRGGIVSKAVGRKA